MTWHEIEIPAHWIVLITAFLAAAVWESIAPRRPLKSPADRRWARHGMLVAVSMIVPPLILRVSPVMVALAAGERQFGLLQQRWIPFALSCATAILLLDLVRYATHRLLHRVEILWRVHEVHHSDPEYDVSTAGRFHPAEVLLAQAVYLCGVAVLGPPAVAVLASGLLSILANFLAHTNAALPRGIERILRPVFITPDLHRIHHSQEIAEQSSNYGQTFSFWDRIFGTYVAQPADGQDRMITGVRGLQNETSLELKFMLTEPFRSRSRQETSPTVKPGSSPRLG